jgi:hypothetical protein
VESGAGITTPGLDGAAKAFLVTCPWRQDTDQLDDGWSKSHEDDGGKDKQDQRNDHLDGGFCGLLFGALPSFGAQ